MSPECDSAQAGRTVWLALSLDRIAGNSYLSGVKIFRRSHLLILFITPLTVLLIGCESSSVSDQELNSAAHSSDVKQAAEISRDEIQFISRPSDESDGEIPMRDLFFKMGDNEIRLGCAEYSWSKVEPGGIKVPADAVVAASYHYPGGAAWFFLVEEGDQYVLKYSYDDEGSFGGEDSVTGSVAGAKVFAVFSKSGETIKLIGYKD